MSGMGAIETKCIGTEKQYADLLTKAQYRNPFSILREAIKCTSVEVMRQGLDSSCALEPNFSLFTTCSPSDVNRDTVNQMRWECKNDLQELSSTRELQDETVPPISSAFRA